MIRYVKIRVDGGRVSVGTLITAKGRRVLVTKRLTRREAGQRLAHMIGGAGAGRASAVSRTWFKKKSAALNVRKVPAGPFVFLGVVPVITYRANKTGRVMSYYHKPKRKPRLYFDPKTGAMLLLGGSTKVKRGWMRG